MPQPTGLIFVDGREVADTLTCVHCDYTWIRIIGSKRKRGWCMSCGGVTCGSRECSTCTPFEKKMDQYEKGLIKTL
jgi:hypothetical protein